MSWYSFAPKSWKWGTLKTIVRRAHINSSNENHLKEELNHNNYPQWVIRKVFRKINEMTPSQREIQVNKDENTSLKNHLLVLPDQGEKGIYIVSSMKRYVNKVLPENVNVQTAFTGKRLRSCFKTTDKTTFEHQRSNISSVLQKTVRMTILDIQQDL